MGIDAFSLFRCWLIQYIIMKAKIVYFLVVMGLFSIHCAAQEKGLFKNNPKIKANKPTTETKPKKDEFEEFQPTKPQVRYSEQFEPYKEPNPTVSEDTSTIDEGQTSVVQQIDSTKVGDDWVQVASYYTIWDSRTINPYGLDPKEFDETINLHLFDPSKGKFYNLPLNETKVTSVFGFRTLGGRSRWHQGMDLDAVTGDPVYATFDGIVRVIGYDNYGYGRFVIVRHYNGLETLYGHLSKFNVDMGRLVKAGDVLGLAGSTGRSFGDHLHYENRYEGNPFSPSWIWDFAEQRILGEYFLLTSRVWDHLRGGKPLESEYDLSDTQIKHTQLHRVKRGETLDSIASQYGLTATVLADKNNFSTDTVLKPGQQLRIR